VKSPFRDPSLRNSSAPRLETDRLILRHVRAEDVSYFAEAHADEEVSRHVGGPIGREDAWRRAMTGAGFWGVLGIGVWAIERRSDGRTIGHIGFFDFQRDIQPSIAGEPEMGWIFSREAQGQGYATEAGIAALTWFDAMFPETSIPAIIDIDNLASIRLAERLGFERRADAVYREKPIGLFRRESQG
jgi:RimJ/RimL family protein N-acetyltransferase